jgi:hypothetical protein
MKQETVIASISRYAAVLGLAFASAGALGNDNANAQARADRTAQSAAAWPGYTSTEEPNPLRIPNSGSLFDSEDDSKR